MQDMVKLTGLWAKKDKNGNLTLSGSLGTARIMIFANTYKTEGSNAPDYNLHIAAGKPREDADAKPRKAPDMGQEIVTPDDIPF